MQYFKSKLIQFNHSENSANFSSGITKSFWGAC
jgi:hypothetical protein